MKRGKFIVFEGLSGVGKTTIAQTIKSAWTNGAYYKTPPELFRILRDEVDEKYSTKSRFHFYLAGLAQASEEIKELTDSGVDVFCDRYLQTTICWHKTLGYDGTKYVPPLFMPDLSVLVTCEKRVRHERLHSRGLLTVNDVSELKNGNEDIFENYLIKAHKTIIDNSGDLSTSVKTVFCIKVILSFTFLPISTTPSGVLYEIRPFFGFDSPYPPIFHISVFPPLRIFTVDPIVTESPFFFCVSSTILYFTRACLKLFR